MVTSVSFELIFVIFKCTPRFACELMSPVESRITVLCCHRFRPNGVLQCEGYSWNQGGWRAKFLRSPWCYAYCAANRVSDWAVFTHYNKPRISSEILVKMYLEKIKVIWSDILSRMWHQGIRALSKSTFLICSRYFVELYGCIFTSRNELIPPKFQKRSFWFHANWSFKEFNPGSLNRFTMETTDCLIVPTSLTLLY